LVKISINRYISTRIKATRNDVKVATQRLREKTLKRLEQIFELAARIARGEVKHQRTNGRMVRITLNQRRRWLRVAEHTAQTIKSIASNLNEQEVYAKLDDLEKLLKEANARAEKGKHEKETLDAKGKPKISKKR